MSDFAEKWSSDSFCVHSKKGLRVQGFKIGPGVVVCSSGFARGAQFGGRIYDCEGECG